MNDVWHVYPADRFILILIINRIVNIFMNCVSWCSCLLSRTFWGQLRTSGLCLCMEFAISLQAMLLRQPVKVEKSEKLAQLYTLHLLVGNDFFLRWRFVQQNFIKYVEHGKFAIEDNVLSDGWLGSRYTHLGLSQLLHPLGSIPGGKVQEDIRWRCLQVLSSEVFSMFRRTDPTLSHL